ncbi:MAG: glycosyltransferase, partial [Treponema sp.]|nr:glycosyltransferase [Treponema sp.]
MAETPLISVVCASYNHEKYVGHFVKSLQDQTYSNWELIIVDDCSSDNNVEEIRRLAAVESRIHLFGQPFNQGPGSALNKAFSESKGEIIVDMASDDSLKNDYFEFVVKTFSEKADIGAIYSPLDVMDENNKIYENWPLDTSFNRIKLLNKMFYGFNEVFS